MCAFLCERCLNSIFTCFANVHRMESEKVRLRHHILNWCLCVCCECVYRLYWNLLILWEYYNDELALLVNHGHQLHIITSISLWCIHGQRQIDRTTTTKTIAHCYFATADASWKLIASDIIIDSQSHSYSRLSMTKLFIFFFQNQTQLLNALTFIVILGNIFAFFPRLFQSIFRWVSLQNTAKRCII